MVTDSNLATNPMPGRPQKFTLQLGTEEREYLEKIVSSRSAQVRHQQRAKILLQRAAGASYAAIEKAVGVSTPTITKVVKKACAYGVQAALEDLKRTGRPDQIPREAKVWGVSLACRLPETVPGAPKTQQWTISALVKFVQKNCETQGHPSLKEVHRSTIWEILNDRTIKPHRMKYYLERKDPDFEPKAKNVLLVYKRIEWVLQLTRDAVNKDVSAHELCGEVFISYDEKPGIQAISSRLGTVSLLAGIDLLDGKVHGIVREKHKSKEFVEFLEILDSHYAKSLTINIILDNHSIHRSTETMEYLASVQQGRFNFIFTPTHVSWLNLIECFFSKLARQALKNLRVKSKADLIKRIEDWLEETNREQVVFRWKWRLEDIENAFLPKGRQPVPTMTNPPQAT